jgi:general stress protein 26
VCCQRTLFILLLFLAIVPGAESWQNAKPSAAPQSDAELIAAAREIIASARYCALITIDAGGRSQARTLDPFPPDEQMNIWLGTNAHSSKVREIRRNPQVVLYYFDREAQAYVAITGRARLVADPKLKLKWWKDEWREFYPNRATEYLLIQVRPERLEIVSVKRGIVGNDKSWTPPTVVFK